MARARGNAEAVAEDAGKGASGTQRQAGSHVGPLLGVIRRRRRRMAAWWSPGDPKGSDKLAVGKDTGVVC